MNTGESILNPELAAAVLAGGWSRRMGRNKALLCFEGRTLVERVALQARKLTDQVYICANDIKAFRFLAFPIISDLYACRGPLSGLHSAMTQSARPLVLLLASDLPALRSDLLETLVAAAEGWDAVIPYTGDGRIHYLAGVYRRTLLPALESNLSRGENAVRSLLANTSVSVKWLDSKEGGFCDEQLENINTIGDWKRWTLLQASDGKAPKSYI